MPTTETFVQLPNGDLWRGRKDDEQRADNVDGSAPATSEDAVMEMVASQRGETISCQWCGTQFTRKQLNEIRAHVETMHKTALKPLDDAAVLAATAPDLTDIVPALVIEGACHRVSQMLDTSSNVRGEVPSGRVVWWLLGIVTAIAIAVSGAWARSTDARVTALENTSASAAVNVATTQQTVTDITSRLDRIELKLDQLLMAVTRRK